MVDFRKIPILGICALSALVLGLAAPGCKNGAGRSGAGEDTVATARPDTAAESPEPFDLMSFSALDTTSGVFEGDYEEKVNEEITVKVRLQVRLEESRITGIELLDTTWVHPAAARLIPQRIIESQRLPVEAVSGASVASWALMAATAVALQIDLTELDDLADDSTGN